MDNSPGHEEEDDRRDTNQISGLPLVFVVLFIVVAIGVPIALSISATFLQLSEEEAEKRPAREARREARREAEAAGARLREPPLVSEQELLELLVDPATQARRLSGAHWRDRARGAHGSVYFQTTLDRAGALMRRFDEIAREAGVEAERVGRYLQPQLGGRCCHLELVVAANARDAAEVAATRRLCAQAAGPLIEAGAFFSRPHGDWADADRPRGRGVDGSGMEDRPSRGHPAEPGQRQHRRRYGSGDP